MSDLKIAIVIEGLLKLITSILYRNLWLSSIRKVPGDI